MSVVFLVLSRVPAEGGHRDFSRVRESRAATARRHRGSLDRRLRSGDGTIEAHLVSFPSPAHFDAYRDDPERERHRPLLEAANAVVELFELHDDRAI